MLLRNDGHYDTHKLTEAHIEWLTQQPKVLAATGPVTLTAPPHLVLPCGLIGPSTGFPPVTEDQVHYACRGGGRKHLSRMIRGRTFPTRLITAICVPDRVSGEPFLITAFGGPLAPKELHDPSLTQNEWEESSRFWAEHALIGVTN